MTSIASLQLSKKDEVRSKVQQLVAREDVLKLELQNMESDTAQDEQISTQQEEQPRNENTQALEQSNGEGAQDVIREMAQNENELTRNEAYDQAPVIIPEPTLAAPPDVVTAAQTRITPAISSNKTFMRFHVRNFEGHNDLICGVDCRGAVLVSGR